MKGNRRRKARELALQGLYQWQLAGAAAPVVVRDLRDAPDFDAADADYLEDLVSGAIREAAALDAHLAPCMSREAQALSPVEHAALLIAAYELAHHPEVPYRVVINEAIELAKRYGGSDGHRFVNGALDRLAVVLRPVEVAAAKT